MYLAKNIKIQVTEEQAIVLNCMCYAASKLWNVANYEKRNYKELKLPKYPNWYDQKRRLKDSFWYKNLHSQTAQELLNQLEQAWKSFFALKKSGGVKNPKPPRFKQKPISCRFLNKGFKREGNNFRLSVSKRTREYILTTHNVDAKYINLEIEYFSDIKNIKQCEVKPLGGSEFDFVVTYQIADVEPLADNGRYLSIDLGLKNLAACYSNQGDGFVISGNRYLNAQYYFNKQIAHYQGISAAQQSANGVKFPKPSKKVLALYAKKRHIINDLLHKSTRFIVDYCVENDIRTVVIGDITGIREDNSLGSKTNQSFHALPFARFYFQLEYKLKLAGITVLKQKESYTSQCSPTSTKVNKAHAVKNNRKHRGLYNDSGVIYNADMVGAYNILRLWSHKTKTLINTPMSGLSNPLKVTV